MTPTPSTHTTMLADIRAALATYLSEDWDGRLAVSDGRVTVHAIAHGVTRRVQAHVDELTEQRDQARDIAVRLEQENANLLGQVGVAHATTAKWIGHASDLAEGCAR